MSSAPVSHPIILGSAPPPLPLQNDNAYSSAPLGNQIIGRGVSQPAQAMLHELEGPTKTKGLEAKSSQDSVMIYDKPNWIWRCFSDPPPLLKSSLGPG